MKFTFHAYKNSHFFETPFCVSYLTDSKADIKNLPSKRFHEGLL